MTHEVFVAPQDCLEVQSRRVDLPPRLFVGLSLRCNRGGKCLGLPAKEPRRALLRHDAVAAARFRCSVQTQAR